LQDLIFNTHDIILLATIYQSILFALLILIVKRDKHKSDIFLIGFLLTQAAIPLHLLINYGDGFRLIALEFSPNVFRLFEIAYWLEGPLLLWYTRTLVYQHYKWSRVDCLFLAPALIYFVFMLIDFYSLNPLSKYEFMRDYRTEDASVWWHLSGLVRESLRVVFSIMCLIDIRHCRQQIRNHYSNVDKIDLGWLNFLVIAFLVVRIWAVFVSFALILSTHLNVNIDFSSMGLIGNYTTFILVSGLIFFSLMRSSLFEGIESPKEVELQKVENELSEIDPILTSKIEDHMDNRKPFLANILTLDQLAKQLEMSPRTLSNTINRHFKQNFFEFINQYRVEEAKAILTDPEQKNKTMIDVMADCGFNSKATFNTFFKKLVGSTPSQYRAEQFAKDAA
jgi:AraC-like DNA-binding protein